MNVIKPYWRSDCGRYTLYHGDCLDILPQLPAGSVDAVVADPPWGLNGGKGGDARAFKKAVYDASFSDTPQYIETHVVPVVRLCISACGHVAITPGVRAMYRYPPPDDVGGFFHPASVTHGPWGFSNFSPILFYGLDRRRGMGVWPSMITVTEASERNGHPCPKPLAAWIWLVNKVAPERGCVLDPFTGSGTTGVACVKLGRRFIGIEIEEKYCAIARRRIEYEANHLFADAESAEPPVEAELFSGVS